MPFLDWTSTKDRMSDISTMIRKLYDLQPPDHVVEEMVAIDVLVVKLYEQMLDLYRTFTDESDIP